MHHWVPLLDHFDAYLERHVKDRHDLALRVEGEGGADGGGPPDPPFPAADLLAVLRVTTTILENSSNKHLYNSFEVRRLIAIFGWILFGELRVSSAMRTHICNSFSMGGGRG